jgi:hypothetical protein
MYMYAFLSYVWVYVCTYIGTYTYISSGMYSCFTPVLHIYIYIRVWCVCVCVWKKLALKFKEAFMWFSVTTYI